ncbi:MAG: response regulator [Verrucomicrobium sp.]|nr:response regulator [Verrucomicrobium sp.]
MKTKETPPAPRVLLADDSGLNLLVAQAFLEGFGVECDIVRDGTAALAKALEADYAAILLDIQMPGLDGCEVARRLRAREEEEKIRRVPIVAVTAYTREGDLARFREAGIDDFLAKPFEPSQLKAKLRTILPA